MGIISTIIAFYVALVLFKLSENLVLNLKTFVDEKLKKRKQDKINKEMIEVKKQRQIQREIAQGIRDEHGNVII